MERTNQTDPRGNYLENQVSGDEVKEISANQLEKPGFLTHALTPDLSYERNFPDFSNQGYRLEQQLGYNRSGGRITYLAISLKTQQPVVIKQFQFAKVGASWSEYDTHQQEIKMLQRLNSPSIPKYLESFETSDGFCLVQEYKQAPSLAVPQQLFLVEIKQIAIAVLEVLVELQRQVPPVIHRDIKPENILVDRQGKIKVYLVDFGLAKTGGDDVVASSAVKGTLGFMPPEQLFNRQLTEASDLYSLGVTLIALLTQTKSADIGKLIDETYCLNFKQLLPNLHPQFADWLSKMVAPNLKNRYPNAAIALKALESIDRLDRTKIQKSSDKTTAIINESTKAFILKLSLATVCITSAIAIFKLQQPVYIPQIPIITGGVDALRQLQLTRQCLGCNLRGANLSGMNLQEVDLTGADLTGANLAQADLKSADLEGVTLAGANLTGADLRGTYLGNADLTAANLTETNLASTDLRDTIMPDGTIHP